MDDSQASVQEQINFYLDKTLSSDEIVIGALRYGAHLPHLYKPSSDKQRVRLLLSHMLGFFPVSFYRNKKFLLLDDTVYQGNEMARLVAKLVDEYSVSRADIRTAALASHAKADYLLDCPGIVLADSDYIVWKEELARLVSEDIRPTDRDHPLFYFDVVNCDLGRMLNALSTRGVLHTVGTNWTSSVFRFVLNVDTACLGDVKEMNGVTLDSFAKVRFYWREGEGGTHLTAVPITFPNIDIAQFINSPSAPALASLMGLEPTFFTSIYESEAKDANGVMTYYFISRAISGLLLRRVLKDVSTLLHRSLASLELVEPTSIDAKVEYVLPEVYCRFYAAAAHGLGAIPDVSADLPLIEDWPMPAQQKPLLLGDSLLPSRYELLGLIAKRTDPARWDGTRWIATNSGCGCQVTDFIGAFKDTMFVSKSLDELFDAGLIRARDSSLDVKARVYGRVIVPGGEFNAVHVSRIADTLNFIPPPVPREYMEAETSELWGSV